MDSRGRLPACSAHADSVPSAALPAPVLSVAREARSARSLRELSEAILRGGCTRSENLGCLHRALASFGWEKFFAEVLPFACDEALRFEQFFPQVPVVIDGSTSTRRVDWTQRQCLCILCNAFLCAWPDRGRDLPHINFDNLLSSHGNVRVRVAKLLMFLQYLDKQRSRIVGGDTLDRPIAFVRMGAREPQWEASRRPLCDVTMRPLGESIDVAQGVVRADFANAEIGGGIVYDGQTQEEIQFATHPELICACLVFPRMEAHEAILFSGAEHFAESRGYGDGLECVGQWMDEAPVEMGRLQTYFVAIDALDYGGGGELEQFRPDHVRRELLKAYAGFAGSVHVGAPGVIATGNWGAGVFGGDAALKALLQWVAASEAGLDMHYYPFDNHALHSDLPLVVAQLRSQGVTVGQLCQWLLSGLRPGYVLPQVDKAFGLGLGQRLSKPGEKRCKLACC